MTGQRRAAGDLQGEIEELFADLWQVPRFAAGRHAFRPQCDCYRTDDPPLLHVVVELPGVDPEGLRVEATARTLLVAGRRARPQPADARYHQVEIEYGFFERLLSLSDEVDPGGVETAYEDGMLRIELPLVGSR